MINNIKINVVYPDEFKNITSQTMEGYFDKTFNTFNTNNIEYFKKTGENFICPIILYTIDLFYKNDTIELSSELLSLIHEGKSKLVFIYPTEANFGCNIKEFIWMCNFSKKYNFKKTDLIVILPNMSAKEKYQNLINLNMLTDSFTIYQFSWFSHNLLFHKGEKMMLETKKEMYNLFCNFIDDNRKRKKIKHFLAFNRVPKVHRLCLFAELITNKSFEEKYITSLGKHPGEPTISFIRSVSSTLDEKYKFSKKRITDFFEKYESNNNFVYDCEDLENNKADIINIDAHRDCFLNVITESFIFEKGIFFTEKTFKPIFACQPFILFSTANSLKKLKEMGYKTFDKWWDESYDDETDFTRRFEKIIEIMTEISTWNMDKCFEITNEMEEVLIHNFNTLMSDKDTINLYKFLNTNI